MLINILGILVARRFLRTTFFAQFIRDNLNIPLLRDVQPEDLEDVTEHFNSYFGIEYDADIVKRIRIHISAEERQKAEEERAKFKRAAFMILKVFLLIQIWIL